MMAQIEKYDLVEDTAGLFETGKNIEQFSICHPKLPTKNEN